MLTHSSQTESIVKRNIDHCSHKRSLKNGLRYTDIYQRSLLTVEPKTNIQDTVLNPTCRIKP